LLAITLVGRARKFRGEAEVLQREAAIASAAVAADLVQTARMFGAPPSRDGLALREKAAL